MPLKLIALIPARSGSERIKNKNLLKLRGKTLLKIAVENALKSKIFKKIIVSTDSKKYAHLAKKYGADVPFLRPKKLASFPQKLKVGSAKTKKKYGLARKKLALPGKIVKAPEKIEIARHLKTPLSSSKKNRKENKMR